MDLQAKADDGKTALDMAGLSGVSLAEREFRRGEGFEEGLEWGDPQIQCSDEQL